MKSTLAAEMLSLFDALDCAIYLWHIISEPTGVKEGEILIRAYVDNQSVVDALYSPPRQLMINDCILTLELSSN